MFTNLENAITNESTIKFYDNNNNYLEMVSHQNARVTFFIAAISSQQRKTNLNKFQKRHLRENPAEKLLQSKLNSFVTLKGSQLKNEQNLRPSHSR